MKTYAEWHISGYYGEYRELPSKLNLCILCFDMKHSSEILQFLSKPLIRVLPRAMPKIICLALVTNFEVLFRKVITSSVRVPPSPNFIVCLILQARRSVLRLPLAVPYFAGLTAYFNGIRVSLVLGNSPIRQLPFKFSPWNFNSHRISSTVRNVTILFWI